MAGCPRRSAGWASTRARSPRRRRSSSAAAFSACRSAAPRWRAAPPSTRRPRPRVVDCHALDAFRPCPRTLPPARPPSVLFHEDRPMNGRTPGFATLAAHAGAKPDPTTGARATPIYQTTSFVFDDVEHAASLFGLQAFGNIYTRIGNPTCAVLEERVAALEGGTAGLAVASGHAAQVIVMHALMMPGDEFVASKKLYGGSINQFNHSFKNFGWNVVWADPDDIASFERAVSPKTKAIFTESIANPGGVITDMAAVAQIARRA